MTHPVTLLDRLRIERLVWTLDQQLYDLPHHSRVAKRREVRANLLEASRDIGTSVALKRLGGSRRLAEEYLEAELGRRPRHSWVAAAYFLTAVPLLLNFFLSEAAGAYEQAITAADPHATGTYTWQGISYLQSPIVYTFDQGNPGHVGGAWSPLVYVLWIGGTIACGRLWRLLPRR
ncbi:hypothetical protein Ssi03_69990 [Sphaerisporangium siamense]|uniref:Uncharacterized protein n=1 Tax=Sphaerisporangium siamense TaxID=795645 RepID=A0A7W7D8T8_9ACTN|nr:hypothetical protein [Sphaerisporangium siamense]MBB4702357.1 hypothetical protein [Sphaerisporangium siamense]GII89009.1 hypothetical protein Ssi03_69990 [Sphaerisporangium siamense]